MQALKSIKVDPHLALGELCRRSFYRFLQEIWPELVTEDPVYNWHIKYLCDELQEACERLARREDCQEDIVINIPPGETKSTICTQALPVWLWTLDATMRTLTASYGDALSINHSTKSRDIIRSSKFRKMYPHIVLKRDSDTKHLYKNTAGGERMATSVGGAGTGFHAHLIVVDDPINPHAAESETKRKEANIFMDQTLSTRKVEKRITLTVLVMQRLHEEDPTGNWLNKPNKRIKHICLPAEVSDAVNPPELKEMYTDGLMNPYRLGRNELDDLLTDLGMYGYAGQIEQTPAPASGGIWDEWLIPIKREDIPALKQKGTDWDLAYTKNDKNSASAYVTAGKSGTDMYITALGFDYLEFPKLIPYMSKQLAPHHIEAKASGKSAKQVLKEQGIVAIEVQVQGDAGDKIGRTRFVTPWAEAGFVYCAEDLLPLLYYAGKQGILKFPNTGTDLNDALVQSINRLLKKKSGRVRKSTLS